MPLGATSVGGRRGGPRPPLARHVHYRHSTAALRVRRDFGCYTGMRALRGGTTSIGARGLDQNPRIKSLNQELLLEPEGLLEWGLDRLPRAIRLPRARLVRRPAKLLASSRV